MQKRLTLLMSKELYDKNLIRAVNNKVIPVAAYPISVCNFSETELKELDQMIKTELKSNNMLRRQSSGERLYLKRIVWGRGLKSLRVVYNETKMKLTCYMATSESKWIQPAWRQEKLKEYRSLESIVEEIMREVGHTLRFKDEGIELLENYKVGAGKKSWKKIKGVLKKDTERKLIDQYKQNELQSETYSKQEKECSEWLECNSGSRKRAAIVNVQEQMFETRSWEVLRGISDGGGAEMCRLCGSFRETVRHLSGCKVLAAKNIYTATTKL